jgi:hypothetical protein
MHNNIFGFCVVLRPLFLRTKPGIRTSHEESLHSWFDPTKSSFREFGSMLLSFE